MSTREILTGVLALGLALGTPAALSADRPGLGQPVSENELALWDISIGPDGRGLPPAMARLPRARLCTRRNANCATGKRDKEGPTPRSAVRSARSPIMCRTRPRFLISHARAMPWQQPKSLTNDEVYAVTAYILSLNKIIGENDVLNAETLPKVQMPNRDGFISRYPDKH